MVVHEGGYSEAYVPFCGLAVIEELSGVRSAVRADMFPHTLLVGKGGYILGDDLSMYGQFGPAVDYAAGMTEKDYEDFAQWAKKDRKSADEYFSLIYFGSESENKTIEEKNRTWVNRLERDIPYTPESKMSFTVSGDGLREIIVDDNLSVLD